MSKRTRSTAIGSLLALGIALLLSLGSLRVRFMADDYAMIALYDGIEGSPPSKRFEFYFLQWGATSDTVALTREGRLPWWTAPESKYALWRPVTSATFWLEHAIFGRSSVGYHAVAVLWFAALVAFAGVVYRSVLPSPVATLAACLYAIDASHALAVIWVTSTHVIIASAFGAAALALAVRRPPHRAGLANWLPLVPLALALAASESGLQWLALAVSHELTRRSRGQRLRAAVPYALLGAAYLLVYKLLSRGVRGVGGGYIDPVDDFFTFVASGPLKLLGVIASVFVGVPRNLLMLTELPPPVALGIGSAVLATLLVVIWCIRAEFSAEERGLIRWLTLGALLSAIPALGGPLSGRVGIAPALGAAGVVAVVLRRAWEHIRGGRSLPLHRRTLLGFALLATVGANMVLSVVAWLDFAERSRRSSAMDEEAIRSVRAEIGEASDVVVLVAPSEELGPWGRLTTQVLSDRVPRNWWTLALSNQSYDVVRTAASTLILERSDGEPYYVDLYRDPERYPFAPGDEVEVQGMHVRVLEVTDGSPKRVEFTFSRSLDDPSMVLFAPRDGGLLRISVPPIGVRMSLPGGRDSMGRSDL